MRFLVLLIVLAFPVVDVLATMRFARWTGTPALAWILASTVAGRLLLHHQRVGFRARTLAALRGERPFMRGLPHSGRKVPAGLCLILPGGPSRRISLSPVVLPVKL